jgi:hypothetical protein
MSRLDDELKIAFERKQPSIDFAARVLERINETPAPKRSWWQTLAELFQPPKLRWVAIGVAASLLVAIGVAQYHRLHETPVEERARIAQTDAASETGNAGAKKDEIVDANDKADALDDAAPNNIEKNEQRRTVAPSRRRVIKRDAAPGSAMNQARLARATKDQPVSAEAEAAKERVLFALQIVGSTLSDAQRVIQEDSQKSKPEPSNNR